MPITDASNFVFFQLINDFLRDEIDTFQWNLLTSTASFVGVIALSLLAIWILFQGFRIITGRTQQPMMALVGDSLRAVLVLSIATGAAGVSSNLYRTLTDGATNAITSLVSHSADSPYANIDKNLAYTQGMLSAIDSLATGGHASIDSAKDRAKWFSGIGIAGPGIIGGSMLLLNKIGIALFVGFGPLFIMCLLFDKTKALFEKWLLYGIGTLFSLAVLSFMVGLANNIVQAVTIAFLGKYAALLAGGDASATEGITSLAMQQGGLGLVLTVLIVSVPPIAAAFFRGVLGQFKAFSAFGAIGRGTERSGHAGHSWREASTSNTTNYISAGQAAVGENAGRIVARRFIQGATSGSNAALDHTKSHECTNEPLAAMATPDNRARPSNSDEASMYVEPKIVGSGTNARGLNYYEWSMGAETSQIRVPKLTAYSLPPLRISPIGVTPEMQYSIGVFGTVFVPVTPIGIPAVGVGGGASIGVSTDGTLRGTSFFGQVQANGMVGVGAYAGIGVAPGVSRSETPPGKGWTSSTSGYFEADAGLGMSGGVAGSIDDSAKISGGSLGAPLRVIPGFGYGAAAGIGASTSTIYTSRSLGDMFERVAPSTAAQEEKP